MENHKHRIYVAEQQLVQQAAAKRRALIRSAQQKVAQDGNARRVTGDEWNALAYQPMQDMWDDLAANRAEIERKVHAMVRY